MQVPGLALNDPLVGHVFKRGVEVHTDEAVEAEMAVHVADTYMLHHGADKNYRPYLHMRGRMAGIIPKKILPGDVDTIRYETNSGPYVDVFYEFNEDQLIQLINKGYFSEEGLTVPEELFDEELMFDVEASVAIALPEPESDQVPVVFVDVANKSLFETTAELSGYDLVEYFREVEHEKELELEQQHQRESAYEHRNIFDDPEMQVEDAVYEEHKPVELTREQQMEAEVSKVLEAERMRDAQFAADPKVNELDELFDKVIAPDVERRMHPDAYGDEGVREYNESQVTEHEVNLGETSKPVEVKETLSDDEYVRSVNGRLVFDDEDEDDYAVSERENKGELQNDVAEIEAKAPKHAAPEETQVESGEDLDEYAQDLVDRSGPRSNGVRVKSGLDPKEAARRAAISAALEQAEHDQKAGHVPSHGRHAALEHEHGPQPSHEHEHGGF